MFPHSASRALASLQDITEQWENSSVEPGRPGEVILKPWCGREIQSCSTANKESRSWEYQLAGRSLSNTSLSQGHPRRALGEDPSRERLAVCMAHSPVLRGVQGKFLHSCCQSRPLVAFRPETLKKSEDLAKSASD